MPSKSLNYTKRKKDIMKIEQENLAIARRLIEKYIFLCKIQTKNRKGHLNLKNLNSDYEKHCALRDRIKRLPSGTIKKRRVVSKKVVTRSKTPNSGLPVFSHNFTKIKVANQNLPLQPIKEQPRKEEKNPS